MVDGYEKNLRKCESTELRRRWIYCMLRTENTPDLKELRNKANMKNRGGDEYWI
jgi:hypothetical protein